jgi:hypothetical protein
VTIKNIRSPLWMADRCKRLGIVVPLTDLGNPCFKAGNSGWMTHHPSPFIQLVVRAKTMDNAADKFIGNYILGHITGDRLYADIRLHKNEDGGARSTRLAYSDPPLQQMTKHNEELLPFIRDLFLPEHNELWATADIRQQEFRLVVAKAAAIGCTGAAEAAQRYRDDSSTDFHSLVAELTGIPRDRAKNVNFAKVYGAGIRKIAEMVGVPEAEARAICAHYDDALPFVKELSDDCKNIAYNQSYITLLDGARRHFQWCAHDIPWKIERVPWETLCPCSHSEAERRRRDINHPWFAAELEVVKGYAALNALIQGNAARQTKLWMLACWREGIVPLLQMHDALELAVSDPAVAERVAELGREAIQCGVPMAVDLKFGRSWGDAKHAWKDLPKPEPVTVTATSPTEGGGKPNGAGNGSASTKVDTSWGADERCSQPNSRSIRRSQSRKRSIASRPARRPGMRSTRPITNGSRRWRGRSRRP